MRENMPKKERKFDSHSIPRRLNLLFGMVIILFVTLIGRLAYMQVFNQDFYTKKLATASQTKIKLSSVRGQIYDASGKPLVENAIYHGIKEIDRQGVIRVTSAEEEGQLILSIYDNGRGFDPQNSEEKTLLRIGGVGLKNVDQRLRLQFGEDYHMEIQSEQDIFTLIKIYLPLSNDK